MRIPSAKISLLLAGAALLLAATSTPAYAQAVTQVPTAASPDRVESQIPQPEFKEAEAPQIDVPSIRVENAPAGAENITFVLQDVQLEGVTAYNQNELRGIYAKDIGQKIPLTRLYAIAGEITRKYRSDGYIISQVVVPAQTIDGGRPRLLVVEGSIDRILIEGAGSPRSEKAIRDYANRITTAEPLTAKALERYLLMINDLPGVKARSIISPSPTVTGKADMRIVVSRDLAEYLLGIDNYGSRYLGPWQASAAAQFNNLFGINDKANVQAVGALDNDELQYGYVAYKVPLGPEGTTLGVDLSHANTEPGYDVEIFGFRGFSTTGGLELSQPIIRSRTQNLAATLRYDYRDSSTKSDLEVNTFDQISSLRAGLKYDFLSSFLGTAVNSADFTFSQGTSWFGASEKGDSELSRPDADPNATKGEIELQRLQKLAGPVNMLIAGHGQLASAGLLTSEEFGLGGMNYGRGYDASEIVGDDGVAGKVELQWTDPVSVPYLESSQLFAFYDVGTVWNRDAASSEEKRNSLASTGLGARTNIANGFAADATMAVPLTVKPQTDDDVGPRFYVSLTKRF